MKAREIMATMWVGLVIVALTLGLVTVGVMWDNRQLRSEGRELRAELDAMVAESAVLKAERAEIQEELKSQRERFGELSVQLAELKSRVNSESAPRAQQAYRVRAYLENQVVGQGWLVPGRATTNSSGQAVYEPVVVLDPAARAAMSPAAPKEAGAQPASVTVNHNYPAAYEGVWPAYWVWWVGGHKPDKPDQPSANPPRFPPQARPQPQPVSPFLSTRIWQPQTGYQPMPRGRSGGEWISSAPRGHSYISSGGAFPERY